MEISIYRATSYKKRIIVNEDSIETAQRMNARGEYDLLWETTTATNHVADEFSFVELPQFDNDKDEEPI